MLLLLKREISVRYQYLLLGEKIYELLHIVICLYHLITLLQVTYNKWDFPIFRNYNKKRLAPKSPKSNIKWTKFFHLKEILIYLISPLLEMEGVREAFRQEVLFSALELPLKSFRWAYEIVHKHLETRKSDQNSWKLNASKLNRENRGV